MKKISVTVSDEQYSRLEGVQQHIGVPVSVQVRRALDYAWQQEFAAQNEAREKADQQ